MTGDDGGGEGKRGGMEVNVGTVGRKRGHTGGGERRRVSVG